MKKIFFALLIISQILYAYSGTYKSTQYPMCSSKQYLEDWTQFSVDKDTASQRAYYGKKCFILSVNIKVSSINTSWGKVSFFYKGQKFWGYREGI